MAKKKLSKSQKETEFSVERYLKERVRNLKIYKCYASTNWEETGLSNVVVSRQHKQGGLTCGIYLVDTFCIGLKQTEYLFNTGQTQFDRLIKHLSNDPDFKEVSYEYAHNLIYAAIEFADEAGIKPERDWHLTQYILENDDENVPLIAFEMGRDGEHFLCVNDKYELSKYLSIAQKTLGKNVEYTIADGSFNDDFDENIYDTNFDDLGWFDEEHDYTSQGLPTELCLKHSEIPELLNVGFCYDDVAVALMLPHDELKHDLEQILLHSISAVKEFDYESNLLFHAIILLTEVGDEHSLDIILETLRQDEEYFDYFGDMANFCYIPTIAILGKNNLTKLIAYLREPNLYNYCKVQVLSALSYMHHIYPQKHNEIIMQMHELLNSYIDALQRRKGCDSTVAAFAIISACEISTDEFLPDIKALLNTGAVDKGICGDLKEIIQLKDENINENHLYSTNLEERYKIIKKAFR